MKIKEIYPNLFLFTFPNKFELSSTFFRLQEFYESPIKKLKGKYFTYEQAISCYAYDKKEYPDFTYFDDWDGFNVPGIAIKRFIKLFNGDLTEKELTLLSNIPKTNKKFYFIGAIQDDEDILKHEIAHGLYYLNKEYKDKVDILIKILPTKIKNQIKDILLEEGYCKTVIQDETNAYLSTDVLPGMVTFLDYMLYWNIIRKFKVLFETYFKEIKK
jgi:hypothetical protein